MAFESLKWMFGIGHHHSLERQELERAKSELHASLRHLDEVLPQATDASLEGASENLRRVTGDVLKKYREMHSSAGGHN